MLPGTAIRLLAALAAVAAMTLGACDRPRDKPAAKQAGSTAVPTAPSSTGKTVESGGVSGGGEGAVNGTPAEPPAAAATTPRLVTETKGNPAKGKRVWAAFGCATCHAIEGKNPQGPSMKGYWMTVRRLADGREVIADAEYTRRAILDPLAEVVPGYPVPMTGFKGIIDEAQVDDLIAYIKSVSN